MSDAVNIRRLQQGDDLAAAVELLRRFFREEGFDTADDVIAANAEKLVALEICGLFVAEAKQQAVGVATVSLDFGIEFGWSAEMGDLYIVPEWRGKGLSRQLVSACEAFAQDKGATSFCVTVTSFAEDHHNLSQYYQTLGLADEGRRIMSKVLSPA